MSEETQSGIKTKVWGGVLFLVGYWLVVVGLVKAIAGSHNYTMADSFSMGVGVATILGIIIYVLLAKKLKFSRKKKIVSLVVLFIFVNITSFYLGRYYYHTSVEAELALFKNINPQQKEAELYAISDKINYLSTILQESPQSKQKAIEHIALIEQVAELYKNYYDLTRNVQDEILRNAKTTRFLNRTELKNILKSNFGLDIEVLPEFRNRHTIWFNALNACLSVKKEYYQAYVNSESNQTQEYLLQKVNALCPKYLQEEAKLLEIQTRLRTKQRK